MFGKRFQFEHNCVEEESFYDFSGNFDRETGNFTVPVTGLYKVFFYRQEIISNLYSVRSGRFGTFYGRKPKYYSSSRRYEISTF